MRLTELDLPGPRLIESTAAVDARGGFYRAFCADTLAAAGVPFEVRQANVSTNRLAGTLRGLHFQRPPSAEGKIVRCLRGRLVDVLVDLRKASPTFGRWTAVALEEGDCKALYVPPGFGHGFQTLVDDTHLLYLMSDRYQPELSDGVRWNDPFLAVAWPRANPVLSEKDAGYPDIDPDGWALWDR